MINEKIYPDINDDYSDVGIGFQCIKCEKIYPIEEDCIEHIIKIHMS